jgi:hypothetical protein
VRAVIDATVNRSIASSNLPLKRIPRHKTHYLEVTGMAQKSPHQKTENRLALATDYGRITSKNEAACAADASREVVERWLPKG